MKRLISLILCLIMIATCFVTSASAVSLSDGKAALENEFLDGEYKGVGDFAYFKPADADKNDTKYPLFIFIHGNSSGAEKRLQVTSYNATNYASDEFQKRFKDTGGAFILLPRSQELDHSWIPTSCPQMKKIIDLFIEENKDSIDTNRIYIAGLSAGGSMVYFMISQYPDFFAAAIPMCSIYQPLTTEMDKWKDLSLWIHASKNDYYASANTLSASGTFNYLSSITNRPNGVRFTSYQKAIYADGSLPTGAKKEHYIWDAVCHDMHMKDGSPYAYATTKDATGMTFTFEDEEGGFIDWLYQQKRPEETNSRNILQRILDFINSLINNIKKLLGL